MTWLRRSLLMVAIAVAVPALLVLVAIIYFLGRVEVINPPDPSALLEGQQEVEKLLEAESPAEALDRATDTFNELKAQQDALKFIGEEVLKQLTTTEEDYGEETGE